MSPAWTISSERLDRAALLGLPERLGPLPRAGPESDSSPSLESVGVDDWRLQVASALIHENRPTLVYCSAATWQLAGVSRWRGQGRDAWAHGARWSARPGNSMEVFLPANQPEPRGAILASLGYDDETYPEFVAVPRNTMPAVEQPVADWFRNPEQWPAPDRVVPDLADLIVAFFDGALFVACGADNEPDIRARLTDLARSWGVRIEEASGGSSWLPPIRSG